MIKYIMPTKIQKELPVMEPNDHKTIGERISETRKSKGLTQVELAEKIGITRDLLCNYEIGRNRIYGDMVYRIATILEVSADKLLGITEKEQVTENVSLRYIRRIKDIEVLPEHKKRVILKALDDMIKANKE